jgi:hypothetical protein
MFYTGGRCNKKKCCHAHLYCNELPTGYGASYVKKLSKGAEEGAGGNKKAKAEDAEDSS